MYTLIFLLLCNIFLFGGASRRSAGLSLPVCPPGPSSPRPPTTPPSRSGRNHVQRECHCKQLESLFFSQESLDASTTTTTHPPPSTLKRNWALSVEQRREEPPTTTNPPPPPLHSTHPSTLPQTLFLAPCRVLLKHSPLLPPPLPWRLGLLKQRALHEKKRLVFKWRTVRGELFQVGAEICSDSRVLPLSSRMRHY